MRIDRTNLRTISTCILVAILISAAAARAQDDPEGVLADHFARYPRMEIQDLYKLIHQASMGSEHAVSDTASARAWMDRELRTLGEGPSDPMLDPLNPDSGIVRVHLRPWLAAGGDPDALLDAFLATANSFDGSVKQLEKFWTIALKMAAEERLPFAQDSMRAYLRKMKSSGYPAEHHSATFKKAYRPAYRVVALRYLPPEVRP